jgi:signal transduction histidine kinase
VFTVVEAQRTDGSASRRRFAAALEACAPRIIEEFTAELLVSGSLLAENVIAFDQAAEHCRQIVADVAGTLRAESAWRVPGQGIELAMNIGTARAAEGVHPNESMRAVSVLFRTVLAVATRLASYEPDGLDLLERTADALELTLNRRVQIALAGYTRFLLNQVREAQASERRRIAREMHDRIGHCLSIIHRQLELYRRYQDTHPVKADQKVEAAQRAIVDSMTNLRALTSDLYTKDPFKSLDTALVNYLDGAGVEGVASRVRVNGDESWVSPDVLDETFMVLREAAHNALTHAEPTMVIVNVDISPIEIRAFVEDDGIGFAADRAHTGGVGILSMRERARLLGGTLAVRSRPGNGTLVEFSVPLTPGYLSDDD